MPRETNIQIRRGSASDWASVNPTLASGEMAIENDTRRIKVGDGLTVWNELRYLGLDGGDIDGPAPTATPVPPTPTPTVAGDPLWSSVGLLVPFDTNTTDVKSGIVPISHDVAPPINSPGKFGSYASYGEVSGNTYAAVGLGLKYAVPAPGTGDFTVEFWLRGQSFADGFGFGHQYHRILLLGHQYGEGPHLTILAKSGLGLTVGITSVAYTSTPIGGDITVDSGSWHHLAAVRQGGTLRVYSNGVQTGTLSDSRNIPDGWLIVGSFSDGISARMGVDDLRYTLACRYPDGTTFTPPTAAFLTN